MSQRGRLGSRCSSSQIGNLNRGRFNMEIFHLVESYEFFIEYARDKKLVRVEIFESLGKRGLFRTRAWIQNTYNLYPTFVNMGAHGDDLRQVHSSDQLNMEITTLVAETPDWITGVHMSDKESFLTRIQQRVVEFFPA